MDMQACETPMSDHIFRFWKHLETEHVRILLDLRRDTSSVVYWGGSSFPDAVAKALVADRAKLRSEREAQTVEIDRLQKAVDHEIDNWKKRNRAACAAEAQLAEAVRLLDALLGLEKGSGEAAIAFVERHSADAPVNGDVAGGREP